MQTLLEHFLTRIHKFIYVVEYTLEAFFLSGVAKIDGFSVLFLFLGEKVSASLLQVRSSFLFESDFFPEISRFINADEIRESDVARLFVKILCTVLQVEIVIAILLEDLGQVLIFMKVLFAILKAPELVHANHGQIFQTTRQIHVLLNLLYDFVLCFRQC